MAPTPLKAGVSLNWMDYEFSKSRTRTPYFEFRSDEKWQFPYQARYGFGDPTLDFSNTQYGLYVQDDWQVAEQPDANLGVRWDYEIEHAQQRLRDAAGAVAATADRLPHLRHAVGGQTDLVHPRLLRPRQVHHRRQRPRCLLRHVPAPPRLHLGRPGQRARPWSSAAGACTTTASPSTTSSTSSTASRASSYTFCFRADGSPTPGCGVPAIAWNPSYLVRRRARGLIATRRRPRARGLPASATTLKPPRSTSGRSASASSLGHWLTALSYAGVRGYNGLIVDFFGDLPPGTALRRPLGQRVGVPGYARICAASTTRQTWYDGVYLTLDQPCTGDSSWGFNLAYTYAEGKQNGTDYAGEGVAFGAFDYRSPDNFYEVPGHQRRTAPAGDERHRRPAGELRRCRRSSPSARARRSPSSTTRLGPVPGALERGRPEKYDFIIPDAWAYRSVDLRLQWEAPPIADRVRISLVGEGFNVFDFDNYNGSTGVVQAAPAHPTPTSARRTAAVQHPPLPGRRAVSF